MVGLHCSTQAFSSCSQCGLVFVAACGPLVAVASLVAEYRLCLGAGTSVVAALQ